MQFGGLRPVTINGTLASAYVTGYWMAVMQGYIPCSCCV